MSIPRCWPAAYGCARSNAKPGRTEPPTGQLQPSAGAGASSAAATAMGGRERIETDLRCQKSKRGRQGSRTAFRCQTWLQRAAVERVPGHSGQARDELRRTPPRDPHPDELADRSEGGGVIDRRRVSRSEDQRDLALCTTGEAIRKLGERARGDLLEVFRQLPPNRRRPLGPHPCQRAQRRREPL